MNIQTMSAYQRGAFNDQTNRWQGINLFSQFVSFCLSRRSYKRKQGKGLTRSVIGMDKWAAKGKAYQIRSKRRQPGFDSMAIEDIVPQYAYLALTEMERQRKRGALSRFFSNLFNRVFARKVAVE